MEVNIRDKVNGVEVEVTLVGAGQAVTDLAGKLSSVLNPATYKVRLLELGPYKINVIKVVRESTTLGLKEAKVLVESAPIVIAEGLTFSEALVLTKRLTSLSASADIIET